MPDSDIPENPETATTPAIAVSNNFFNDTIGIQTPSGIRDFNIVIIHNIIQQFYTIIISHCESNFNTQKSFSAFITVLSNYVESFWLL
jgi:hypothetical protein